MFLKKYLYQISLLSLIFFGFILRIYNVAANPAGFFADEASIGYNAYLLLTKGVDEHGMSFPVFFRSFGDYRPPIPFYAAIPSVALFGLNEFSVRLTTAIVGTLTIFFFFLFLRNIANSLFKNIPSELVGLWGAFTLTVSPWHIHFSRFGAEYIYLPFFIVLTSWFLTESKTKPLFIPLTLAAGALTGYTYLPGVIIGPLFVFGLIMIFSKKFLNHKKLFLLGIFIYFLIMIPTFQAITNRSLLTRWRSVGLEKQTGRTKQLFMFFSQYLEHFSPKFLFILGDLDYPGHFIKRFGIKGLGQLYVLDLPFVGLGLFILLLKVFQKNKVALYLMLLLALYPVGSSITTTDGGGPLAFRSILGSVVFPAITTIGGIQTLLLLRSKRTQIFLILLILASYFVLLGRYLYLYHQSYPLYSQNFWGWQFGPREIMKYFLSQKDKYEDLFLTGRLNSPEIFLRFYDPENQCQDKCKIGDATTFDPQKRQLFALGVEQFTGLNQTQFFVQKIIRYPDGSPAFYIGTLRSNWR